MSLLDKIDIPFRPHKKQEEFAAVYGPAEWFEKSEPNDSPVEPKSSKEDNSIQDEDAVEKKTH